MSDEHKPILFALDDDPQVLRAVRRDLRERYKADYRILASESATEALESLRELKKRGETIALFLSDQRMPDMLGVAFLEKARALFPQAKRVLLTAYSDTDAAIRAINEVRLDYYLIKPWNPPEERLYPVLDELLDDWQAAHKPVFRGIKLVGHQYSPHTHNVKDFLAGNLRPYQWLDIREHPQARELLEINGLDESQLPVVFFEDGSFLSRPEPKDLALRTGLSPSAQAELYDVVIIGAGPAGLSAAVYGASEGLKTLLIERRAPGGQAGTSSRIENYLGFPSGLSGGELTRRALTQATRFGAEFLSPQEVRHIHVQDPYKILELADGSRIHTRSVIITTGVQYRQLDAPGLEAFTGRGVYYGAAITEANACRNREVYIVGGGNSAGQGAVYLSNFARRVHILIRKPDLSSSMSSYLIEQIASIPNITVHGQRAVHSAEGGEHLERLCLQRFDTQDTETVPADALFIFIGAKPVTDWLGGQLLSDDKGYLETGRDLLRHAHFGKIWKKEREPFLLETCVPGIFAAGDVRAGAMNRVASAVGEGAMAIKFVHEYLAEQ